MKKREDLFPAIGFLAPNFIGFLLFTFGPVLAAFVLSFTNYSLTKSIPFQFVWFENFREIFSDTTFWVYFINTAYLMLGMPFAIIGSLMLAMLLTKNVKFIVGYRTLYYLPQFTAGVALMLLWKALLNPEFGFINQVLGGFYNIFGITADLPSWLNSTKNLFGLNIDTVGVSLKQWGIGAKDALNMMGIWTAIGGTNMLLYIAALNNIPQDLYEAAEIDGAGAFARFKHITWPQLAPTTFFIVIMGFIGGLQGGMVQAKVMTEGGPAGTTTTLTYYIYQKAFDEFQIGYASAVSLILFLIIFIITIVNWKYGNKRMEDV